MNSIQLIGRLTRDPELRSTKSGKPVANMRFAVPRRDRDAAPVYVDVVAYDALAEICAEHLEKGRQVAVSRGSTTSSRSRRARSAPSTR